MLVLVSVSVRVRVSVSVSEGPTYGGRHALHTVRVEGTSPEGLVLVLGLRVMGYF